MVSIAVFNNKGGVGKTTLLCNLASYLQIKKNKKILVIDADPQCNASIYVTSDDELEKLYSNSKTKTIYDIIRPLQRGNNYIGNSSIPIKSNENFGFDFILGDSRLSLMEDFLSADWIDGRNGGPRGLKTTFVFFDLLQKLANEYDYVFFDVGPSLGAINRCVLLSCDYFIMPMSSDIFSLKAVDNISKSLTEWKRYIDKGLKEYQNNSDDEPYKIGEIPVTANLRFLGYIYQQYTAKTKEGVKQPVKAYENIIKRMNNTVSLDLNDFYAPYLSTDKLLIGKIPILNSLIPLSQTAHKPIFRLLGSDGVVGAHFLKVKEYESVVAKLVEKIDINLCAYEMA